MSAGVFIPMEVAQQLKKLLRNLADGSFVEFKSAETVLAVLTTLAGSQTTSSAAETQAEPPIQSESEIRERLLIELSQRPDWQVRVLVERAELGLRVAKLARHINSDAFRAMPELARGQLKVQFDLMTRLLNVLNARIDDFPAVDLQATRAA